MLAMLLPFAVLSLVGPFEEVCFQRCWCLIIQMVKHFLLWELERMVAYFGVSRMLLRLVLIALLFDVYFKVVMDVNCATVCSLGALWSIVCFCWQTFYI